MLFRSTLHYFINRKGKNMATKKTPAKKKVATKKVTSKKAVKKTTKKPATKKVPVKKAATKKTVSKKANKKVARKSTNKPPKVDQYGLEQDDEFYGLYFAKSTKKGLVEVKPCTFSLMYWWKGLLGYPDMIEISKGSNTAMLQFESTFGGGDSGETELTEKDVWDLFWEDADKNGFSLEYGTEDLHEAVFDWMLERDIIVVLDDDGWLDD